MPIRRSPYVKRPEHVVVCAVPACERWGLRENACWLCGEYRCPEHAASPIQGYEYNNESIILISDPSDLDRPRCFLCGNHPARLSRCDAAEFEKEFQEKTGKVEAAIRSNPVRQKFGLLLLHRFETLMEQLDQLESPLEEMLWAELFARNLDRYLVPQVNVYGYDGHFIARVDFASTLLRIAIFTDGRTYHSSPKDQARDKEHNERLVAMGWVVRRYWTEDIRDNLTSISDEIYHVVSCRIAKMQDRGLPITAT